MSLFHGNNLIHILYAANLCYVFYLLSGTAITIILLGIMFGILGLRDMKNAAVVDGPSVCAKLVIKLPYVVFDSMSDVALNMIMQPSDCLEMLTSSTPSSLYLHVLTQWCLIL